jgi:hypothetical protein
VRRGTGLVEALLFSAIAVILIFALFTVFRNTQVEVARTTRRLRGVQALHVLLERLQLDLRTAVHVETPAGPLRAHAPDPHTLEIFRHDDRLLQPVPPDGPDGISFVPVVRVRYTYDPRTRRVSRALGAGKPEPLLAARYREVSFRRAARAGDPPLAAGAPPTAAIGDLLEVRLEWLPEELSDRPAADQGDVLTAAVVYGLEGEAAARRHALRVMSPTSQQQLTDGEAR